MGDALLVRVVAVAEIRTPALGQLGDAQHFTWRGLLDAPQEPGVETRIVCRDGPFGPR
ncbi:MAG: hypothetical protein ABIO99_01260 [Candidatus Limnocylindria bacterium]